MPFRLSCLTICILISLATYSQFRIGLGIPAFTNIYYSSKPIKTGIYFDLEYQINSKWATGIEYTRLTPGFSRRQAYSFGARASRLWLNKPLGQESKSSFYLESALSIIQLRDYHQLSNFESRINAACLNIMPGFKLNKTVAFHLSLGTGFGAYAPNFQSGSTKYVFILPRPLSIGMDISF